MTGTANPELVEAIAAGARTAFNHVTQEHPHEHFYGFVLWTNDGATFLSANASSEESLSRKLASHKNVRVWDVDEYRWRPYDWGYECVCETPELHAFEATMALMEQLRSPILAAEDFEAYARYEECVRNSMVEALAALQREGFWGAGPQRKALTVFASVVDSAHTGRTERRSARRANPLVVYWRFLRRYRYARWVWEALAEYWKSRGSN